MWLGLTFPELLELWTRVLRRRALAMPSQIREGVPGPCWEYEGARTAAGYGSMKFRQRFFYSHRVAACLAHNPHMRTADFVLHACDNPPCFNPDHLHVADNLMNCQDKVRKGRQQNGEGVWSARQTWKRVWEMRKDFNIGLSVAFISEKYGVPFSTVEKIVRRVTWKGVGGVLLALALVPGCTPVNPASRAGRNGSIMRWANERGVTEAEAFSNEHYTRELRK